MNRYNHVKIAQGEMITSTKEHNISGMFLYTLEEKILKIFLMLLLFLPSTIVYGQNISYELPISIAAFEHQTHRRFTEKEGLPNNDVKKIRIDSLGRILVETSNGIAEFDSQRFQVAKNVDAKI